MLAAARKAAIATMTSKHLPFVVSAHEGIEAPLGRLGTVHKVPSVATDARVAIVEHVLPSHHLGAPRHRHSREDELSIVLSGEMGLLLGDRVLAAGPGSYVMKPRGQWHTFWNPGRVELRLIEVIVPGGLEECLEQLAPMLSAAVAPPHDLIARTAAQYGVEFDFDSVGYLCRRFDLTPW